MFAPLFADAWQDFFKALPFIVALLVWVINQFAGKVKAPPPQKRIPPANPVAPQPPRPVQQAAQQPGQKPLQAEIDEFLRQAQSLREGRPVPPRQPAAGQVPPQPAPAGASRRPSPPRPQETTASREPPRQSKQATQRPLSAAPGATEPEYPRETVAQYVAEHIDSSKFAQRATALSQLQQESDAEFQQHMQRVFDRDLGKLKPAPLGLFEAAGATAAAATAAATQVTTASAAGNESATAPTTIHKTASNIALFLAGRKNIRDAVILTEILQRPEHRW